MKRAGKVLIEKFYVKSMDFDMFRKLFALLLLKSLTGITLRIAQKK